MFPLLEQLPFQQDRPLLLFSAKISTGTERLQMPRLQPIYNAKPQLLHKSILR